LAENIIPRCHFEDVSRALERRFKKDGLQVLRGRGVAAVQQGATGVRVTLDDGGVIETQALLAAVGRKPRTRDIGLENTGAATDKKGFIVVDAHLRAAEGLYAIGDVLASPQLAHVASAEGFTAVDNLLGVPRAMDYTAIPRCVYTEPEVAAVGATESQLKAEGRACTVGKFDMTANGKARAAGKTDGFAKVIAGENDVILGGAVVGAHATEMITALTLAVHLRLTAAQLGGVIFPHPTQSEALMEAVHDVHGRSIHKV
jgi:dihydrolipoamide dehydrogenase